MTEVTASRFANTPSLAGYPSGLAHALTRVPSFLSAESVSNWWGSRFWEQARIIAQRQGNTDDRPLYWTRLRMRQMLRNFNPGTRFSMSTAQREQLILGFENASRGMPTGNGRLAWIPGVKKILISGFDPFNLATNDAGSNRNSNASGAAVLALDGKVIRASNSPDLYGQIQGVVLPVTFNYFDQGNVERFFGPYIKGDNPVDMVMTISQGRDEFELEEHASRFRNPLHDDNENELGGSAVLSDGPEFIDSSLPRARMRRDALNRDHAIPEEREYLGYDAKGNKVSSSNQRHRRPPAGLSARKGSGGDFLSNEVFYRTSLLRISGLNERTVKVGHLHIPVIRRYANERNNNPDVLTPRMMDQARNEIIEKVKDLIVAALPEL